ncbi:MAG: hypothetical protein AAFY76_14290 [Cyanobacteria bacterium J06649_11]
MTYNRILVFLLVTSIFLSITCLLIACKNSNEREAIRSTPNFEETILRESKLPDGRTIVVTSTAITLGEDSYLATKEYDEKGNLVKEYGYRHYGTKYKNVWNYEDSLIVSEYEYIYSFQDSNYRYLELYDQLDTLIEYPERDSFLSHIMLNDYYEDGQIKKTVSITPEPKKVEECDDVEIRHINNYDVFGQRTSEYIVFADDTINWSSTVFKN